MGGRSIASSVRPIWEHTFVPGPPKAPPGVTREEVSRLLDAGWAEVEIARKLRLSKSAVCYHARNLSRPVDERFARQYDWSAIQRYYDEGHDLSECVTCFGFSKASWSQAVKRSDIRPGPRAASIERYLVVGRRTSRTHLKARLLAAGLKAPRCEGCKIEDWRRKAPVARVASSQRNEGRQSAGEPRDSLSQLS